MNIPTITVPLAEFNAIPEAPDYKAATARAHATDRPHKVHSGNGQWLLIGDERWLEGAVLEIGEPAMKEPTGKRCRGARPNYVATGKGVYLPKGPRW